MKTELKDNVLTIFLEGRVDSNNAPELEKELLDIAAQNDSASKIQIDVDKLEYISSAGLRVLLKLRKEIKNPLPVINASNELYEIFSVTGFVELLEVHKKMREVSVEGCEVIGTGVFATVYRLDSDTIVKIYRPEIKLDFIEQERNTSQSAFLLGVPTAISYDVVKCGESYGVVYEMINAKTVAQIFDEDPGKIPEIARKLAEFLKELHAIVPGPDAKLPNRKQEVLNWCDSISKHLTKEEAEKLKNFIQNIPERDTFLHGDYHAKNIMLRDGEFQLIDIGSAAVGHPIFDIAFCICILLCDVFPNLPNSEISMDFRRRIIGFDLKYTRQVWEIMCGTYFGLSSPEEIEAKTKKLMPYSFLFIAFIMANVRRVPLQIVIEDILRGNLLPAIDTAEPLDF